MNPLLIVLTGIVVGFLGGMFGMGGSSISTPLLRILFLIPSYQALASPLPMTLVSSSLSGEKYQLRGFVDWDIVKKMVIVIILGSLLGAYFTKFISGKVLMILTAIFLIYVSIRFLSSSKKTKKKLDNIKVTLAGFFIGLISGMLANGGGILIVPVLVLLGLDIKRAIGTSMALVFFSAIPSILVHWYLGHIDWWLTLYLSIGAIPGAYLGAYVTVSLPRERIRKLYGIFLLLFSIYFAMFEISSI